MDENTMQLVLALYGFGLMCISIGQFLLNRDVRKLQHGLKNHSHGIKYVDDHGNDLYKTDIEGNRVI